MSHARSESKRAAGLGLSVEAATYRAQPEACCPISRQLLTELSPHELYVASDGHGYAREALADYFVAEARQGRHVPTSALTRAPMLADVERLFTRPWPDGHIVEGRTFWRGLSRAAYRQALALWTPVGPLVAAGLLAAGPGKEFAPHQLQAEAYVLQTAVPSFVVHGGLVVALALRARTLLPAYEKGCLALAAWAVVGGSWHAAVSDRPAWLSAGRHQLHAWTLSCVMSGALAVLAGAAFHLAAGPSPEDQLEAFARSYAAPRARQGDVEVHAALADPPRNRAFALRDAGPRAASEGSPAGALPQRGSDGAPPEQGLRGRAGASELAPIEVASRQVGERRRAGAGLRTPSVAGRRRNAGAGRARG